MRKILHITLLLLVSTVISAQSLPGSYLSGRSKMMVNSHGEAIELFNQCLQEKPGDIRSIYNRGVCYYKTQKYEAALSDFLLVNKRRKGMSSLMLAKTETKLGHHALAVNHLRDHLKSSSKLPEKEILLDPDLMLLENTQGWKNLWKEKEWYSSYDVLLQEARYLKNNNKLPEALNILQDLKGKGFQKSLVNQLIAEIYNESGNNKSAMEALGNSITSDPKNFAALKLRISLHKDEEEYAEALSDCRQLLRYHPDQFEYFLIQARLESKVGAYEKAIGECEKYQRFFPDSAHAYNTMGEIQFENGKYLNALAAFNQTLQLETGSALYYFNRGKTYLATNTHSIARKDFSMALDLDPLNPDIWFSKGLAEEKLGNIEDACFCFKQARNYGMFEAGEYYSKYCK